MTEIPPLRFWLVKGPGKEDAWCKARGRRGAATVFRGIPPQSPRGANILVASISRERIRSGTEYWLRLDGESVRRIFGDDKADWPIEIDDSDR